MLKISMKYLIIIIDILHEVYNRVVIVATLSDLGQFHLSHKDQRKETTLIW